MNYRFTDRTGGLSTGAFGSLNLALHVEDDPEVVSKNRQIVQGQIGLPIQYMEQVHGDEVALVEGPLHVAPTADALLTRVKGIALAVMVADCIPLLLANQGAVAAVHVGRRGLLNGVAAKTLSQLRALDSSPVTAIVGPSICGSCYEVSQEIFEEVTDRYPLSSARTPSGAFSLNLSTVLIHELIEHGVTVIDEGRCTAEESSLYSYRRDGMTGRQVGIVWL